jgi:two-component system response regulator HydG
MPDAAALLISSDSSLVATCRGVVESVPRLRLAVSAETDPTEALSGEPEAALLLLHLRDKGDTEWARGLLQQVVASGRPLSAVALAEKHLPDQALALFRLGVADYLSRPVDLNRLSYLVEMLTVRARHAVPQPAAAAPAFLDGESPAMRRLLGQVLRVAGQDTAVLLGGETGTGKTRLARLIHEHSPRAGQPFLVVNCGALAPSLIESEMFGHVRGAFTGADRDRVGKFTEAGRGTVLLDEVDSLPPSLQAKLLRVIGERVFEPVGSNRSLPVRARVIAATNRDLRQEIREGRFRADLFHRLNVVGFCLPPLRERRNAIPALAAGFAKEFAADCGGPVLAIDPVALQVLVDYSWPGNIRELRNAIERAVVLCPGDTIRIDDLPDEIVAAGPLESADPAGVVASGPSPAPPRGTRREVELAMITDALRRHMNNKVRAAAELGISRMTLYNKLQKFGLA